MDRPAIYVNHILTAAQNGIYGSVNEPKEIAHCLKWAFRMEDAEKLKIIAKSSSNGASVCSNFWHFIIYAHLDNNMTSGTILYFDCKNDMELAFEACNLIPKDDSGKSYKQDFMEQFLVVQEKYDEIEGVAVLTLTESL